MNVTGINHKVNAFTLTELLIAVTLVGILASVAYPAYTSHVTKANRLEAKAALLVVCNQQEQYFVDRGSYATKLTELGYSQDSWLIDSGLYQLKVSSANTLTFVVTAEAKGTQLSRDSECSKMTINELGEVKVTSSGSYDSCW